MAPPRVCGGHGVFAATLKRVTRRIRVLRGENPGGAARDTALSRLLLEAVSRGDAPECLRVWRPCDALAFSVLDRTHAGFASAVSAAREAGFEPFLRLTGGHAAVYTDATVAFAWTLPAPDPHRGIRERFDSLAELVAASLCDLGVDAHVGPVSGEYCPGAHSVNARGRVKLMGVGQRVVRGAAHVGGVVVVGGAARLRAVLGRVYAHLALPFDPAAVGATEEEAPGADWNAVANALLERFAGCYELVDGDLDPALVAEAQRRALRHRVDGV